jgi:hypothetical protein
MTGSHDQRGPASGAAGAAFTEDIDGCGLSRGGDGAIVGWSPRPR